MNFSKISDSRNILNVESRKMKFFFFNNSAFKIQNYLEVLW